MNTMTRMY